MNLALLLNPETRQAPSFGMQPLSSGFYPNQQQHLQQQQYHEDLHSQEADEGMSQELNFDPRLTVDYLLNERGSMPLPPPPTSPPSSPADTYTTTTTTTTTTTFLAIQAPPGSLPFSPCSTTSKCPTSPTNLPVSSPQQQPQQTTQRPRKRGFESNADGPAMPRNKSNIGAKPKKTRRRLKSDEQFMLESVFTQNNTPDTFTKLKLSQALHMSPQQVSNWFQNKRSRVRRDLRNQGMQVLGAVAVEMLAAH